MDKVKKRPLKPAMRVAIAQDVIKLLKIPSLTVAPGYCFLLLGGRIEMDNETQYDGDSKKLQKAIPKIAKTCSVCARGAMVLAQIHMFDGVDRLPENTDVADATADSFGALQADLIESAFECRERHTSSGYNAKFDELFAAAVLFGRQYEEEPRIRLRKIMQNIIVNNGTFKPLKKAA